MFQRPCVSQRGRALKANLLRRFIYLGFALSGAASLVYEVVWTRSLTVVMGSSTFALSTILSAFMAGLSVGGLIGSWASTRVRNLPMLFAACELFIGLMGFLSPPMLKLLTPLFIYNFYRFHPDFSMFSAIQFATVFMVLGIPTTLMGITFPVVIKHVSSAPANAARAAGRLYSLNTLGAIAGSVGAGFLLVPMLGTTGASYVAASLNVLTALVIMAISGAHRRAVASMAAVALMAVFAASLYRPYVPFFSYYSAYRMSSIDFAKRLFNEMQDEKSNRVLFHREGVEGDVYLMEYKGYKILFNNGKMETGDFEGFALLSYLPFITHLELEEPRNALIIGLGTGHTLKSLSSFPIEKITSVELNPDIMEAVRLHMFPKIFNDRRIKHVAADGRNYLMLRPERFDIIISSPSWAVEHSSAGLLTDEFFALASSRLHKSGVFATWLDYFLLDEEDMSIVLRTFSRHFRHASAWHIDGDNVVLVGSNSIFQPTEQEMMQSVLSFRPDLRGKFRLLYSSEQIKALPEGRINTDDMPLIEFHNARNIVIGPEVNRRMTVRPGTSQ